MRVTRDLSLITTMIPIGSRQATKPARWFGLPKVDHTLLVGPKDAWTLRNWIQSQWVLSSTSAVWMRP